MASYLLTSSPICAAGNVNKVFGPDAGTMPLAERGPVLEYLLTHRYLWVAVLMLIHCFLIIGPTHLVLKWLLRPAVGTAPEPVQDTTGGGPLS